MSSQARPMAQIHPRPAAPSRRTSMSSSLRCFEALRLLSEEPYELTLRDVARRLGIPKGSAHRVMATLLDSGFVVQDPATSRYCMAGRAFWVGTTFLRRSQLYNASFLALQDLARRVEATAHVGVCDDDAVLFLYAVGFPSTTHVFANAGDRRPVHATATGKVLISEWPPAEVERLLARSGRKWTPNTIITAADMRVELEEIRRRGYATNDEEWLKGYRGIAAPVRGPNGSISGAITVSGPSGLFRGNQTERLSRAIMETANRISFQLGYQPWAPSL